MNVRVLAITLGGQAWGHLFQYGDLCRFVALPGLPAEQAVLSLSMLAAEPAAQMALWADVKNPLFNAQGGRLPPFFQNLLPEGVLRSHLAQLRGCREDDHFELLAACGGDLPGAVGAQPVEVDRATLQRLVTQDQDALEMSVVAEPLAQGISVSGVQPKLGLVKSGARYVARARTGRGTRVIAKLPVPGQPGLPLLEYTSLQMARAAGCTVCDAELAPLAAIDAAHGYALPDEPHFLAVARFDRIGARRIHFEDFAQILATDPQHKYRGSYRDMALAMQAFPSLGDTAVLELLRRIAVNELLGNPDAHLKNFGVLYADGRTPQLAPAYDVVAYAAVYGVDGHALPLMEGTSPRGSAFTPAVLRDFCRATGTGEPLARRAIADTVAAALERWPALLAASALPAVWQQRLLDRLQAHPLARRAARRPRTA
jgi:serine/threonine-protein kinase HipA